MSETHLDRMIRHQRLIHNTARIIGAISREHLALNL
jgi:hypothetical protein